MTTVTLRALAVGATILGSEVTCSCDEEALINNKCVPLKRNDCLMLVRRLGPGTTTTLVVQRGDVMYRVSSLDYSEHNITLKNAPKHVKISPLLVDSHMQFDMLSNATIR